MIPNDFVAFAVGTLVGGLALFVSAAVVRRRTGDYEHAVVTALLGALAWAVLGPIPVVGGLLALVGWIWVLKWRYPGGWTRAAIHGVVAWVAAIVVLAALELIGLRALPVVGIPGP